MFIISEEHKSGTGEYGASSLYRRSWIVKGTAADNAADETTVIDWVFSAAGGNIPSAILLPATSIVGYLTRLSYEPKDGQRYTWLFEGEYTPPAAWRNTGDNAFSFNTAGGTRKIQSGLSHVQTYLLDPSGSPTTGTTAFDGVLGWNFTEPPAGVDVDAPAFDFQYTLHLPATQVTGAYVGLLKSLTDTVCAVALTNVLIDDVPYNAAVGECRFKGATGSRRGFGDFEVTLNFSHKPNHDAGHPLTIGQFTDVVVNGWDNLTIAHVPTVDATAKALGHSVAYVFVDQIYPYENWTGLIPGVL